MEDAQGVENLKKEYIRLSNDDKNFDSYEISANSLNKKS